MNTFLTEHFDIMGLRYIMESVAMNKAHCFERAEITDNNFWRSKARQLRDIENIIAMELGKKLTEGRVRND